MLWEDKRIIDYYQYQKKDGFGKEAIEVLAGINKCSISDIEAIIKEGDKMPKMDKDTVIRMYNEGKSVKEIAEAVHRDQSGVYKYIRDCVAKGILDPRAERKTPKRKENPKPVETESETRSEAEQKYNKISLGRLTPVQRLELLKNMIGSINDSYRIEIIGMHAEKTESTSRLTISSCGAHFVLELREE